jgi:hypothetical protein
MRQFFKNEFKTLEIKTGLKQYDKIMERDDHEEIMNALLDEMVRVCGLYSFIPDNDKENIIKQNILTDPEFTGFNGKIIYKWLAAAKHLYFKEQAHIDSKAPAGYKVLEGKERDEAIKKWLASLGDGVNQVPKMSSVEIQREGKEDKIVRRGTGYKAETNTEFILDYAARVRAGRDKIYRERHPEATDEEVNKFLDNTPL